MILMTELIVALTYDCNGEIKEARIQVDGMSEVFTW